MSNSVFISAQVKEANIDWKTIKNSEGKIKLTEIKIWGADANSKDEIFKYPSDICRDSRGNYYIVDSGENTITIFDKNCKYVKKIGRTGAGPGDLNYPVSIDVDAKDNLWVVEMGNNRIQMFENGKSKATMNPSSAWFFRVRVDKNNRIALKGSSIANGAAIVNIYNYSKKVIGKAGAIINNNKDKNNYTDYTYTFSMDKQGNSYICDIEKQPLIEKYSPGGKLIMKISFQLSAPLEKSRVAKRDGKGIAIIAASGPKIQDIDVDNNGNIYALVLQKEFQAGERGKYSAGILSSTSEGGATKIKVIPPKERKNKFDNYALIIFDKNGNLVGKKSLDCWADEIRMSGEYIFVIDSYLNSVIHQYKLEK
jgi:hypothetical protein